MGREIQHGLQGTSQTELAIAIRELAGLPAPASGTAEHASVPRPTPDPRAGISDQVFIVYEHDRTARDQLESLLRSHFLQALDDANLPSDEDLRATMRSYIEWAVDQVMTYSPRGSEVPQELPAPRWSWDGLVADPALTD